MAEATASLRGSWRGVLVLVARFGAVGLLNTAFGYGVFALLVLAGVWPGAALTAATLAGVAFNYQTSRRLVFREQGQAWRFVAIYAAVLAVNWLALHGLHTAGLPDLVGQAMLTLPMAALSFTGQRLFVFRARE